MERIGRPSPADAPAWYPPFWAQVGGEDLIAALQENQLAVQQLIAQLSPVQLDLRYAPGKWSLKQVLIHLADEERYYAYKAFCCSRGTPALLEVPMSADYCADFNAGSRSLVDIRAELMAVRAATLTLFRTMTPAMLDLRDDSRSDCYTARSLGWFTAGHSYHHLKIIKEQYLTH
jgi:hypothetical protein